MRQLTEDWIHNYNFIRLYESLNNMSPIHNVHRWR
ncbi:hypothetical protein JMN32_03655 [Fulvivirga sp. 29W222]|uniref:Uncharacterized protein n=1 Tax=Fulvivirga marina TaxID=2494733 RepID=A0A937FUW8_9BACT|nr:hypothetical protein [Fulvivirga marina]